MFKHLRNLYLNFKTAQKRFRAEIDMYYEYLEFYSDEDREELYNHSSVQIFLNGRNIYSDNPRRILVEGSNYFSGYDIATISMIKICIFCSLLETDGKGIEVTVAGDKWKCILNRYYFRDILLH